ncbi:MAG: hypothetical protein MOGMAGMI_02355 [Candidatus Omnitrophica bacterium]|nr:hypothetical protein [Candidatus Omnitrophota bacterium]
MALVATIGSKSRVQGQFGPKTVVRGTLAFDNAYPTNGETVLLSQVGLSTVDQMKLFPYVGYVGEWDGVNKKVKLFYADYDANADGPLIEVAANANAVAVSAMPFEAIGDEA